MDEKNCSKFRWYRVLFLSLMLTVCVILTCYYMSPALKPDPHHLSRARISSSHVHENYKPDSMEMEHVSSDGPSMTSSLSGVGDWLSGVPTSPNGTDPVPKSLPEPMTKTTQTKVTRSSINPMWTDSKWDVSLPPKSTSIELPMWSPGETGTDGVPALSNVLQIQADRRRLVWETCGKVADGNDPLKATPQLTSGHPDLVYNDEFKYIWCTVPKVASTSWKVLLVQLENDFKSWPKSKQTAVLNHVKMNYNGKFKRLYKSNLDDSEIGYRLDNYYKFMFVREPLERLLSAYNHMFHKETQRWLQVARKISSLEGKSLKPNRMLDFHTFLSFMTRSDIFQNVHWQSFYDACSPCEIDYDFIGHYETLKMDGDFVVEKGTDIHNVVHFPKVVASRTALIMKETYQNIPSDTLHKLVSGYYAVDYAMFGYNSTHTLEKLGKL